MGLRQQIRKTATPILGRERVDSLRHRELAARKKIATRLDPDANTAMQPATEPTPRYRRPEPIAKFARPTMTRHEFLKQLHTRVAPRTYLEIGVRNGDSLTLSRAELSIGIDPAFNVRKELHGHVELARTTSDEFFADDERCKPLADHLIDLAFIDGMHLSEFSLRDFINVERYMAPTGIAMFDDMLPRNALEAARVRKTNAWAGDVYKVVDILAAHRLDLTVIPVNTAPTGTVLVFGVDSASRVLHEAYESLRPLLEATDPQVVSTQVLTRSTAVDPRALLDQIDWTQLVSLRDGDAGPDAIADFAAQLAGMDRIGA